MNPDVLKACIRSGIGSESGVKNVAAYLREGHSAAESIKFIKAEFGCGGAWPCGHYGGEEIDERHSSVGLEISFHGERKKYSWNAVVRVIKQMMEAGEL